jgi:hypothetical protein
VNFEPGTCYVSDHLIHTQVVLQEIQENIKAVVSLLVGIEIP